MNNRSVGGKGTEMERMRTLERVVETRIDMLEFERADEVWISIELMLEYRYTISEVSYFCKCDPKNVMHEIYVLSE